MGLSTFCPFFPYWSHPASQHCQNQPSREPCCTNSSESPRIS